MMKTKLPWLVILLLAACATGTRLAVETTNALAEAERAFALDAQTRTVNEAFLSALGYRAILFRPVPVDARKHLTEKPYAADMLLRWTPTYAEASSDRNLGFTTGPAEAGTRGTPPQWTGHFVSLWERNRGVWKLVLDAGTEGPIATTIDEAAAQLKTYTTERHFNRDGTLADTELGLHKDYVKGLRTIGAPDLRLYRDGHAPTAKLADAIAMVEQAPVPEWQVVETVQAMSGDLGYVYGILNPTSQTPRGYLRIYRRTSDARWQLIVDLN